jgi:hypothetical protein
MTASAPVPRKHLPMVEAVLEMLKSGAISDR